MSSLRVLISRFSAKKVPALSLVMVAIVGMVAGVLAVTMVVTPKSLTGESGTYHSSTGSFTVTDTGLAVVANGGSALLTTAPFGANGSNVERNTALTAGNWMEVIEFTTSLADSSSHTATVTVRAGSGTLGTTLATTSLTMTAPGSASTGKVTLYVDLGGQSITSPLTVYVSVN